MPKGINEGYLRHPAVHGDRLAFVCEDALWTASIRTGAARRLTDGPGEALHPVFSPDGKHLAFTSTQEGTANVYLMPSDGGEAVRLTWHNSATVAVGWTPDGKSVIFRSSMSGVTPRRPTLFSVEPGSGRIRELPVGPGMTLAVRKDGRTVLIGRNAVDPARWKRYRGGTCGVLWTGDMRKQSFRKLLDLPGNVVSPMWLSSGRAAFLSDHEDHGNIYSCKADGTDLRRHTHHTDFYARFPAADGRQVVYQHGAELRLCRPDRGQDRALRIRLGSSRTGRSRKFVSADGYLNEYAPHPKGRSLLLTSRGRLFHLASWDGAVRQLGARQGARYRLAEWLSDGRTVLSLSDESGEELFELWDSKSGERTKKLKGRGIGYVWEMAAGPKGDLVAVADEDMRLHIYDVRKDKAVVIDRGSVHAIGTLAWSPDGRYLAYSKPSRISGEWAVHSAIWVHDNKTGKNHDITGPDFFDHSPVFDPEGRFLAFLSHRYLNPVADDLELNYAFPVSTKPYLIPLRAGEYSPLFPMPIEDPPPPEKGKDKKRRKTDAVKPPSVEIDFDGISRRIEELPVSEGQLLQLFAVKGKLLYLSLPKTGVRGKDWLAESKPQASMECWDFVNRKQETLWSGISDFDVSADGETAFIRQEHRLRALKAGTKPPGPEVGETPGPESGWLDLGRIRLEVDPAKEWEQIYLQAWRDQRDFFWDKELSGVDWKKVRDRYRPLLKKIGTRGELSDLIWDMQGELGTSHAYELGGDYPSGPYYPIGLLGADLELDQRSGRYRIARICEGDPWMKGHGSPLLAAGVNAKPGEFLLAVDGVEVKAPDHPNRNLANRADVPVSLKLGPNPGAKGSREITLRPLGDETRARYRDWVVANRAYVSKLSEGRLGYLHIPDMGANGVIEFHRGLHTESGRQGLIVDVRFNGGGHASAIMIGKLARRPLGYSMRRSGPAAAYPDHAVGGPMVALCDELAGSDGDIFSQAFKMMRLGTLVGKRTWGGVIGINGMRRFVDQGLATQPEFAFWFKGIGWGVENHGVDPDIEVEWDPASWVAGKDPQLDRALEIALAQLEDDPGTVPEFGPSPKKAPKPLRRTRKR